MGSQMQEQHRESAQIFRIKQIENKSTKLGRQKAPLLKCSKKIRSCVTEQKPRRSRNATHASRVE